MTPPPSGTLQEYIYLIPQFFSNVIIPSLLGLAFLMVVINTVRYFVIAGATEDGRKHAKAQIIYSLAAFVGIFIFWGVVTLVSTSINMAGGGIPCPDYLKKSAGTPCQTAGMKENFAPQTYSGQQSTSDPLKTAESVKDSGSDKQVYSGDKSTDSSTNGTTNTSNTSDTIAVKDSSTHGDGTQYTNTKTDSAGDTLYFNSDGTLKDTSTDSSLDKSGTDAPSPATKAAVEEYLTKSLSSLSPSYTNYQESYTGLDDDYLTLVRNTKPNRSTAVSTPTTRPQMSPTASCESGVDYMRDLATSHDGEQAYALCRRPDGSTFWQDVTTVSRAISAEINYSALNTLRSQGNQCTVFHNHPQQVETITSYRPPSHGDLTTMCEKNDPSWTIVDATGIWSLRRSNLCTEDEKLRMVAIRIIESMIVDGVSYAAVRPHIQSNIPRFPGESDTDYNTRTNRYMKIIDTAIGDESQLQTRAERDARIVDIIRQSGFTLDRTPHSSTSAGQWCTDFSRR